MDRNAGPACSGIMARHGPEYVQHRQTDYEHVQAVRDQRAREACVAFYLRGVIEVAGEAAETAPIDAEAVERS